MKKGNLLASIGIAALLIFLTYTVWILSSTKPLEVQGEVEATQIKVASKLIGRIDSIAIHKGDYVKKGQMLFSISSPEIDAKLAQANAALKGAKAQDN